MDGTGTWTPGSRRNYMKKLTRNQSSLIFQARTRMLKTKDNYRAMYKDLKCRACGHTTETQQHILKECPIIHKNNSLAINTTELFDEDTPKLRETAKKNNSNNHHNGQIQY